MDIKDNLAQNLTFYRKSVNLTQAELAEKLNYSDKAVSKWERGESVPDLYVLKQLADFYGVKIDTLIDDPLNRQPVKHERAISKIRATICLCATGLVWLIAILGFSTINIIIPSITQTWLALIYALPITFIILLVLTAVWKKSWTTTLIISLLIWSFITALYLTLFFLLDTPPATLWMLYLVGIPAQALTVFWYLYRKFKKAKKV